MANLERQPEPHNTGSPEPFGMIMFLPSLKPGIPCGRFLNRRLQAAMEESPWPRTPPGRTARDPLLGDRRLESWWRNLWKTVLGKPSVAPSRLSGC